MSTFKSVFTPADMHEVIGLNRVKTHMSLDREFGQISASRGNLSAAENYARHKELMGMVKSAGLGYTKGNGAYPEAGSGKINRERSLMVFPREGQKEDLHGFLMRAGAHFTQDSIIHKPKGSDEAHIHVTTDTPDGKVGDTFSIGKFHANMTGPFGHSEIQKGTRPGSRRGRDPVARARMPLRRKHSFSVTRPISNPLDRSEPKCLHRSLLPV